MVNMWVGRNDKLQGFRVEFLRKKIEAFAPSEIAVYNSNPSVGQFKDDIISDPNSSKMYF
jgi:hypothetical protein